MNKIRPLKRLGQNFLIDKSVVRKIIKAANLKKDDVVLEIGPGLGALTKKLAKIPVKVLAVEKDKRLCEILRADLKEFKNVEIVHGDILKLAETRSLLDNRDRVSVVANLPFYITAPVIRKFLESEKPPKEMVLIIQKEVAQRICAKSPRLNLLAVSVQFYSKPEIISYVSKKSFWPQPEVDAAIIKIKPQINADIKQIYADFFKVVKAGFAHPRKQLVNNLSKELKLNKSELSSLLKGCGIKPSQRAETLTINDWLKLTKVL